MNSQEEWYKSFHSMSNLFFPHLSLSPTTQTYQQKCFHQNYKTRWLANLVLQKLKNTRSNKELSYYNKCFLHSYTTFWIKILFIIFSRYFRLCFLIRSVHGKPPREISANLALIGLRPHSPHPPRLYPSTPSLIHTKIKSLLMNRAGLSTSQFTH